MVTKNKVLKKRWFLTVAIITLIAIGLVLSGCSSSDDRTDSKKNKTQDTSAQAAEDIFNEEYEDILSVLEEKYNTVGVVSGSDGNFWKQNNERNPTQFPHEYRDINFDNDEFYFETKVIKDSSNMNYFKSDNTCLKVKGNDTNCLSGEVGNNTLYIISLYADDAQPSRINQLAEELKTTLSNASN